MSFSSDFFKEGGPVARELAGYEMRSQQIRMAEAVEQCVESGRDLLAEAGTGVGKSLAYLAPLVEWAVSRDKKVAVSTYTKALQNQLFVKDLPFLKQAMGLDLRYTICMGSENYVCLKKANRDSLEGLFDSKQWARDLKNIKKWLVTTRSGLATDMDFAVGRSAWSRFAREADLCSGRGCKYFEKCFYMKARKEQLGSHVLIMNHSLLFASLVSESKVLPEFHALVLDEAHTLEDVATTHFSRDFTSAAIEKLTEDLSDLTAARSVKIPAGKAVARIVGDIERGIEQLREASADFFESIEEKFGREERTIGLDGQDLSAEELAGALREVSSSLEDLEGPLKGLDDNELIKAYAGRCLKLAGSMEFVLRQENQEYVYWLNVRPGKNRINRSFHAAPVDISGEMRSFLFDRVSPVILTSATLSLSGESRGFDFIKSRLGLDGPLEIILDSPFDYEKNVLTYLPPVMADPNEDLDSYQREVTRNIIEIYDVMGGRMFALFTSYAMLNAVADGIAGERGDIKMLKQGDLPRYVLLDVFKKCRHSILMGTMTFWQGVDVPGSALECVVITKLPFFAPNDPVNAARIRFMRNKGLNPFDEYQVPQAIIMFKQGFGRLVRSHSDRGVVAVLDPRVKTRPYGARFLKALPGCREVSGIQEVRDFFK